MSETNLQQPILLRSSYQAFTCTSYDESRVSSSFVETVLRKPTMLAKWIRGRMCAPATPWLVLGATFKQWRKFSAHPQHGQQRFGSHRLIMYCHDLSPHVIST